MKTSKINENPVSVLTAGVNNTLGSHLDMKTEKTSINCYFSLIIPLCSFTVLGRLFPSSSEWNATGPSISATTYPGTATWNGSNEADCPKCC